MDACTTRLRLSLAHPEQVQAAALKQLGARGLVRPGGKALEVIVGPGADQFAGQIRAALRATGASHSSNSSGASGAIRASTGSGPGHAADSPPAQAAVAEHAPWPGAAALLAALGGARNVRSVQAAGSRLRVLVGGPVRIEPQALAALGVRTWANARPGCVHVIVGPQAPRAAASLCKLLSGPG